MAVASQLEQRSRVVQGKRSNVESVRLDRCSCAGWSRSKVRKRHGTGGRTTVSTRGRIRFSEARPQEVFCGHHSLVERPVLTALMMITLWLGARNVLDSCIPASESRWLVLSSQLAVAEHRGCFILAGVTPSSTQITVRHYLTAGTHFEAAGATTCTSCVEIIPSFCC